MKKLIYILLFIPFMSFGATYYVATDGNDGNDGLGETAANAWLTWQHAVTQLSAGDTLFIRAGTYNITSSVNLTSVNVNDGTEADPIVVENYTGEVPILDATNGTTIDGMFMQEIEWWEFIGLTVQNAEQDGSTNRVNGWNIYLCDHIDLTRCASRKNDGAGFRINQSDSVFIYHCDADSNFNPNAAAPAKPGGAATGFVSLGFASVDTSTWPLNVFTGCRSWNNSDNGFSTAYGIKCTYDSCWAWRLGWQLWNPALPDANGDGRGFAIGISNPAVDSADLPVQQHKLTNCISAFNKGAGYHLNCNGDDYPPKIEWYNNVAWETREYGFLSNIRTNNGWSVYRNNYAYQYTNKTGWLTGSSQFSMEPGFDYISTNNSWDAAMGIALSTADFLETDSATINDALPETRVGADSSLPDLGNVYALSSTSDLIDAGVDVGLPFLGSAPDLGPFEGFDTIDFVLIDTSLAVGFRGDTIFTMHVENDTLFWGAFDDGVEKWWSVYKASGSDNATAHYWRFTFNTIVADTGIQVGAITIVDSVKIRNDSLIWHVGPYEFPVGHRTADPLNPGPAIIILTLLIFIGNSKRL